MRRSSLAFVPGFIMPFLVSSLLAAQPREEHRATHLGNPATRFAKPLTSPADLRAMFANERMRPDIISILNQWGWRGSTEDLFQAAARERIRDIQIPVGTRLPFMSSRENGKPIVLRNVVWAGKQPAPAYEFVFNSKGRRYRCVTPKACSNFLLVDLGPVKPNLQVELALPPEVSSCDPFEARLMVRNAGHVDLNRVAITTQLPEGLSIVEPRPWPPAEISTLRVGEVRPYTLKLAAQRSGSYEVTGRAASPDGGEGQVSASTTARGPVLVVNCNAPDQTPVGRPVKVCFTLRNEGNAPDTNVKLSLPLPSSAVIGAITGSGVASGNDVVWTLDRLNPREEVECCVEIMQSEPGTIDLAPSLAGTCGQATADQCQIRVRGVPGILMEVIDLEDPIQTGTEAIYEIRVTNQGLAVIQNVRLVGTLSELQEFASGTGPTLVSGEGRSVSFGALAILSPKASASWRVNARALQPGIAQFQVTLESDSLRREVLEVETTNQY